MRIFWSITFFFLFVTWLKFSDHILLCYDVFYHEKNVEPSKRSPKKYIFRYFLHRDPLISPKSVNPSSWKVVRNFLADKYFFKIHVFCLKD